MALIIRTLMFALIGITLAGCKPTCPTCYEDAWSREPFPGQPKQHIPTPVVKGDSPIS